VALAPPHVTNTSTQNTQLYESVNSSITSSFSAIQASFISSGTNYNTLALNPNGGNVGIGTTNPSNKLEVSKNLRIFAAQDAIPTLLFNVNPSAFSDAYITGEDNSSYGHNMGFYTSVNASAAVKRMTILGNGNVGIGTTTPGYPLSVGTTYGVMTSGTFTLAGTSSVDTGYVLPAGGLYQVNVTTNSASGPGGGNYHWWWYGMVNFNNASYVGAPTVFSNNNANVAVATNGHVTVSTPGGSGSFSWIISAVRVC